MTRYTCRFCADPVTNAYGCHKGGISQTPTHVVLDANVGSQPEDGVCRIINESPLTFVELSYDMTAQIDTRLGDRNNSVGAPGIIFNVLDSDNFDFFIYRCVTISNQRLCNTCSSSSLPIVGVTPVILYPAVRLLLLPPPPCLSLSCWPFSMHASSSSAFLMTLIRESSHLGGGLSRFLQPLFVFVSAPRISF